MLRNKQSKQTIKYTQQIILLTELSPKMEGDERSSECNDTEFHVTTSRYQRQRKMYVDVIKKRGKEKRKYKKEIEIMIRNTTKEEGERRKERATQRRALSFILHHWRLAWPSRINPCRLIDRPIDSNRNIKKRLYTLGGSEQE